MPHCPLAAGWVWGHSDTGLRHGGAGRHAVRLSGAGIWEHRRGDSHVWLHTCGHIRRRPGTGIWIPPCCRCLRLDCVGWSLWGHLWRLCDGRRFHDEGRPWEGCQPEADEKGAIGSCVGSTGIRRSMPHILQLCNSSRCYVASYSHLVLQIGSHAVKLIF
ncbi:hypothetical protein AB1Y20_005205 [Prymnesium parvum]|uniref:Uncharacterized protein n=1 Tax=Prymnesium parvum TaxID=97485 RepID=A0AB34J3M3_PRYPA